MPASCAVGGGAVYGVAPGAYFGGELGVCGEAEGSDSIDPHASPQKFSNARGGARYLSKGCAGDIGP